MVVVWSCHQHTHLLIPGGSDCDVQRCGDVIRPREFLAFSWDIILKHAHLQREKKGVGLFVCSKWL